MQWLGVPDLVGDYQGRPVAVRTFSSGGHARSVTEEWTVVEAMHDASEPPLLDVWSTRWAYGGHPGPDADALSTAGVR